MSPDRDVYCFAQVVGSFLFSGKEYPLIPIMIGKIAVVNPLFSFIGMSPTTPSPDRLPDDMIYLVEGYLGTDMSMIHRPASYYRIELTNESCCWSCFAPFNGFPNFIQETFEVLLRGLNDQFSIVVFSDVLSQEIYSFTDMGDEGLFGRKS